MIVTHISQTFFPGANAKFWDVDGGDCTNFATSELLAREISEVQGEGCTLHGGVWYTSMTVAAIETECEAV